MYYCNKYSHVLLLIVLPSFSILAQGNCLLYSEGSGERKACELSYQAIEYQQGSKESQQLFDQAIKVGPKYAYAYYQKSVPFFKRGLFAEGVSLINKAIELEPQNYLFYRAYYYFYNRSYELCIRDLEELYKVHRVGYATTPGGELEMRLLLAMSYAHTGNVVEGIQWMLNVMDKYELLPHLKGVFDHFCLGVLYYENNQLNLAKAEFEKQLLVDDDFADTFYYLGLIKEKESQLMMATEYYQEALIRMERKNGGYSMQYFTEFNTLKEDVENKLKVN